MTKAEWEATKGCRIALVRRMGLIVWGALTIEQADEAVRLEAGGTHGAAERYIDKALGVVR